MKNKQNGTRFEHEFARLLFQDGFWVHCITDNVNGQPFDVIAVQKGRAFAFDCKDCRNNQFCLSRIEENQANAMRAWREAGNGDGFFVLRNREGEVFLLAFSRVWRLKESGIGSLDLGRDGPHFLTYSEWLEGVARREAR